MASRREIVVAGETLWLCGMTGVVSGEKKWSETRVYGGGGGGYIHRGDGYVASTTVTSSVKTRHEFWLVGPDEECSIELGNSTLSVREGQLMTAIWGAAGKKGDGPYLMLRNINTQTDTWLIPDTQLLLKRMGAADPLWKYVLIAALPALLLLAALRGSMAVFIPGTIVVACYFYGVEQRKAKVRAIRAAVTGAMNLESEDAMARQRQRVAGGWERRELS